MKSPLSGVIIAATVPTRPDTPKFVSATDSSITILLSAASDDGGAPVTQYVIYADDGNQNQDNFTPVMSYNG